MLRSLTRATSAPWIAGTLLIAALALFCLPATKTQADDICDGRTTVIAKVVALDQPIMANRMGANLPGGMMFALERDVCPKGGGIAPNGQATCGTGSLTAGNVMVKPYKRPRPIVLRVNAGQCLEVQFTNLLADAAKYICNDANNTACSAAIAAGGTPACPDGSTCQNQPPTRMASVHMQGLEWTDVKPSSGACTGEGSCNDGSFVGDNPTSLAAPGDTATYTLLATNPGTFVLYSAGDTYTPDNTADGGTLRMGLFGAVHVQPRTAEYYRSQVTQADLEWATSGTSQFGQPLIDYTAHYPNDTSDKCYQEGTCRVGPVLSMLCTDVAVAQGDCEKNELVHTDLTAIITGPDHGRFADTEKEPPILNSSYALPDRLQPYREFTITYHDNFDATQAFATLYNDSDLNKTFTSGQDAFGFNYGMGGIGSEILSNRLGVGPVKDCTSCKYEEFFLTSWALGDPAMVVDNPADSSCTGSSASDYACSGDNPATVAYYPDDPSNVYHSYLMDHTKFRVIHAGVDLHHLHHQHAHQWMHSPDTGSGDYTDSQSIGPGSAFTLEMVYNGSGNVNQTVGDSIFHCHFYPHFAGGMWSLWRVHDVYEIGTKLADDGKPASGPNRALPDAEITTGTPIPAIVPLPTLPMPPIPAQVELIADGKAVVVYDKNGENPVPTLSGTPSTGGSCEHEAVANPADYSNPGYPFFIPGEAGQRAPHPPMDFAYACFANGKYTGESCTPDFGNPLVAAKACSGGATCEPLNGGLPRHIVTACPGGDVTKCTEFPNINPVDFHKTMTSIAACELPEGGTFIEQVTMAAMGEGNRLIDSTTPENKPGTVNAFEEPGKNCADNPGAPGCRPAQFVYNGLAPIPGAPYADPCIDYPSLEAVPSENQVLREYKAADIQFDGVFNKEGWHFPQQRILSLWGDVFDTLDGTRPPEPLFFRANSGECISYTLANLVPNLYELDDFQVRTPTDILGQHIHLVKFDVTSSDGATNGWNYEDGTFAPNEVTERIQAIRAHNSCTSTDPRNGTFSCPVATDLPFFGPGPGGQWVGAQATLQRWYADPLLNGTVFNEGKDRTLRTVFTHDHFGPSTHQQAGLYAGLVIEPEKSGWYWNENPSDKPFGGVDRQGNRVPGRVAKSAATGDKAPDGGPTTWQAVIEPQNADDSFREFLLEIQDSTLTYEPFSITPPAFGGYCSNDDTKSCTPATNSNPKAKTSYCGDPNAVCYAYGFCSTDSSAKCKLATWFSEQDISACPVPTGTLAPNEATCNLVAGVPSTGLTGNLSTVYSNLQGWNTTSIEPPKKNKAAEIITLQGATTNFSFNYRNEPLFERTVDSTGTPSSGAAGDMSFAYRSIDRPNLKPVPDPYPPLTFDVSPNDPYTPLLRTYAGDDVQLRVLMGAHINPHNIGIQGVKWLMEPSFVDSGWRASQVAGISEHFEQLYKVQPKFKTTTGERTDYTFMAGASALEQAGGNWGIMRAYNAPQDQYDPGGSYTDNNYLRPLPQNDPDSFPDVAVCPENGAQKVHYDVVAITAKQALGGALTYSTTPPVEDANAILYYDLNNLDCDQPATTCTANDPSNPQPLVLRAPAGACITVTLYNAIDASQITLTGAPNSVQTPTNLANQKSNTSTRVGLHPQLVSYDGSTSNGFDVGQNAVQTVAAGGTSCAANPKATVGCTQYTWYAGNIDPTLPVGKQHIPIEFGGANLQPSDVFNHYQHGLFGALIIEPADWTWDPKQTSTAELIVPRTTPAFWEFVVLTPDGLSSNPLAPQIGGGGTNAINYHSEPLFDTNALANFRSCPPGYETTQLTADVSCVLSSTESCCGSSNGSCTSECSDTDPPPTFAACAGDQVRFRLLHPGGVNTNQVMELYGHNWLEAPYISSGMGCDSPTTHTNLHASSAIGDQNICATATQTKGSLNEWEGSRMGHGPGNHFDILIESAGGQAKVTGDYLLRSYPSMHFKLGLWGLFNVVDKGGSVTCAQDQNGGYDAKKRGRTGSQ